LNPQYIARIETELGVRPPDAYRDFLVSTHDFDLIDDTTVADDPQVVVEATQTYRKGFAGLPPWPAHYLYIGDEADACPYVLDCETGELFRSHKGTLSEPLERFADFSGFFAAKTVSARNDDAVAEESWRDRIPYHQPLIIFLLLFFAALPAFGVLLKLIYWALFE
jgi:hypothetical protein